MQATVAATVTPDERAFATWQVEILRAPALTLAGLPLVLLHEGRWLVDPGLGARP